MEIEILEQQCGGTEFVPSPHRLHLKPPQHRHPGRRMTLTGQKNKNFKFPLDFTKIKCIMQSNR